MSVVLVTIARTAGSAPREAGTQMQVWPDRIEGTIGGGALEWQAIAKARHMLIAGQTAFSETVPLGPGIGQCCGGSVTLEYAAGAAASEPANAPVWIWGAGHVGAAMAQTLAPLPEFDVTLIDDAQARIPKISGTTPVVATNMPLLAAHAPDGADHLIVTYSHEIDLALCHALLQRKTGSIGLIGSATKWARFRTRLGSLGHNPESIARIACPIGDPSLGKHPQAIAVGVAAALIKSRGAVAQNGLHGGCAG